MTVEPVVQGLHRVADSSGRVNTFLWDFDGDFVLIDAGLPETADAVLEALRTLDRSPEQLTDILITHSHRDHIGGLTKIKTAAGARVAAGAADVSSIETQLAQPGLVDRRVQDGEALPAGLQAVATPGHTPGHICFLQPDQRILFAGDALFNRDGLSAPPTQYTADMGRALQSIQHLSHLTYDVACFGHGDPLVDHACTVVDRLAETL